MLSPRSLSICWRTATLSFLTSAVLDQGIRAWLRLEKGVVALEKGVVASEKGVVAFDKGVFAS